MKTTTITILLTFTLAGPLALASGLEQALRDCAKIEDDAQRLACIDVFMAEPSTEQPAPAVHDGARVVVDKALAQRLVDPLSAIDYSVSDPLSCEQIHSRYAGNDIIDLCICWRVNSRNRMGGYVGTKLRYGVYTNVGDLHFVIPSDEVKTPEGFRACHAASMTERSAAKIANYVRR